MLGNAIRSVASSARRGFGAAATPRPNPRAVAQLALLLLFGIAVPAAQASTGCDAINSNSVYFQGSATYAAGTLTSGLKFKNANQNSYSIVRTSAQTADSNVGGNWASTLVPDGTTTYTFAAGDTINLNVDVNSYSGTGTYNVSILHAASNGASTVEYAGGTSTLTSSGGTVSYVVGASDTEIGLRFLRSGTNLNADIDYQMTCVSASGPATQLDFVQQPTSTVANAAISPSITVRILDAGGTLTTSTAAVTLAIANNPASGTLAGTSTVNAVAGVATFPGLSINKSGNGYTLSAASAGLSPDTSSAFNITPGATTQFTVTAPSTATAGVAFNTLVVTAKDAAGNTTPAYAGTVHFTSSDGAAVLPANSTLTSGTGTFSATLNTVGSRTITATDTVTGSITGTSGAITVATPAPTASAASANAAYSNGSPAVPTNIDLTASVANASFVSPATAPTHGTLNVANGANAAGKVLIYTPTAGYHGADSFTYRAVASDGTTVSASPATVTITVADPVLTASVSGTGAAAGAPLSGYTIDTTGGFGTRTCAPGATAPPAWLTVNSNCTLTGTPPGGGTVNFGVDVTDQSNPAFTASNKPVSFNILSNDATLSALAIKNGATTLTLTPSFASGTISYTTSVASNVTSVTATPTVNAAGSTVTVNTVGVTSGNPSGAIGLAVGTNPVVVHVTAPDGVTTKDYTVTVTRATPVPTLTSLSASVANGVGSTTGGGSASTLTLTGSDFTNATQVNFGAATLSGGAFTIASDTSITLTVPTAALAGATGAGSTITVSVASSAGTSGTQSFTYVLTPTVNAVTTPSNDNTPTFTGTAAPNATINLTLTGPSSLSTSAITANGGGAWTYTPTARSDGSYTVSVTQTLSTVTSGSSGAVAFDIDTTGPAAPVVTSPTEGASTGSNVTLTGTTEAGTTVEVKIDAGGFLAASVTGTSWSYNATGLAVGGHSATVRARDALTNPSTDAVRNFTVASGPSIGSLSPSGGPIAGGNTVTVNGANLTGATLTVDGGAVATSGNTGSSFSFVAPAHAVGPATVVVTTVGGTASSSYTYIAPVTLSPASGTLPGGTAMTAYSQSFTASGGTSPYTYGSTGTLPPGTTLSAGGALSGTPTAAGTFNFNVTATDNSATFGGSALTATESYSIAIALASQTITFGPLPNTSLSAATLTLTGGTAATASSTLAVTYGSTTTSICTVSGNVVTLVAIGTCTITADQAGNAAYSAAPQVSQSFTVTPATLTIAVTAPVSALTVGTSYTQTNQAAGGLTPYIYAIASGALPAGTTLDPATGTVAGSLTTAGGFSYSIQATDHQGTPVTVTGTTVSGTIAKANQTITFQSSAPIGASVGGAAYTPTVTASSGLPVTLSLDGASSGCVLSGGTITFNATGTCVVNANQAGDSNWNPATQDQQSFTVNAAGAIGVTVSFSSSSIGVGQAGTATITFTNGNASASPNIAPLFSGSALVSRGALGGTCGASGADSGADFQFNGFSVPGLGSCTVTIDYTGVTAGSVAGLSLGGFTPSGYAPTGAASSSGFAVLPTVTGVSPNTGPVGQVVTVSGTGFSITPGNNTVTFGSAGNGAVTAASATSLTVTAPAVGTGAQTITVKVNNETSTGSAAIFTFVAPPTTPPVSQAVAYDSPGTVIHLASSITGSYTSVIVTTPTHGTATIAGTDVTYIPTAGYFGPDSFDYTATGTGGSNTGTVTLTVATPAAPTVAAQSAAVPYNSAGTAIDLSGSISGVHTGIATSTPSHGTVTITNDVVTYTPTTGYFGLDSFTYTATGPGGTSPPATVTVTVGNPPAPSVANKTGVAVPYASTGTAIDLTASITGVHTSIATSTPANGTVSIAGDVVTYTPAAGYYGADSFTYTATGPGGTSAPATVSLTVATPAAPVTADKPGVAVPYASAGTAIDLTASITGVHATIAIGTTPAHGSVTIAGDVVTYTPAASYYGADSFTYTATGPGGTSNVSTVNLTVATPAAPVASNRSGVAVAYNSAGTAIDLSGSITGVHASIATSTPSHGTVTVAGDVVTYTPATGYFGPDSFTFTATGPGGSSLAATVSLTVATPAAPVAADKSGVAVPYASTGTAIDLSGSVTGVHTAIAIGTAPAHGTVAIAGDVVTYTPNPATYYGADSFTFTATGPGGTSAPATVSLSVALPPAPVTADKSGVAVPYASAGTAIDLSGSITGVRSAIAIGTAPAHGTVTIAGEVVTYTPAATYYGADSFTYTATGPGGTSAASTVSVTVATPAAPVAAAKSGVSVGYNSAGTAIDLAPSITGVHSALTVATAPTHGTTTVSGDVVTYKPTAGYFGADSFAYTVTGPGGTSAAATVSLTVATPPPPVAAPGTGSVAGSTTTAGTSVNIDLSALVTGVYDTIQIQTPPAHGTVTLSGGTPNTPAKGDAAPASPIIATYTPAVNYAGTDSFTFVAVGPGGTSAPGTVSITVVGQVPVPVAKTATTGDGQMVSVMLTDGAQRGPFTGATVVSVSPASAATTAIVAAGGGYRLDVTPNNRFGGTIVVTYTLSNLYGASLPSTVTLTVQARPDPRNDPNVGAISDAQSEATRRFARAQVSNFMRRTEQLHNGGGQAGMAMGVTLVSRDGYGGMQRPDDRDWGLAITERMRISGEDPAIGQFANDPQSPLSRGDKLGYARTMTTAGGTTSAADAPYQAAETNEDGTRRTGSVATWAGGAIDIGTRDKTTDRTKVTATTAGLSAGADIKLGDGIVVGLGGGYGNDLSRIGSGAQVRGTSTLYAAYASLQPAQGAFIDGVIGRGQLDFTTRRIAAAVDATARGSRDGNYTVAGISLGIDRSNGGLQWSIYGRGEYMDADLKAYTESGAGRYNLRFDARQVSSITGTIGARFQYRQKMSFGSVTPRVRAEWNHEFADVDAQWLDYADIPGAATYALTGNGWKREQLQLSLGARFDILKGGWSFDFETGLRTGQGEKAGTLQLRLSKQF
ncbi:tandem-95 repeat protein [Sphingomonas sp. R-74633]|uniref:tandem-95 repeat protein n=1 Tax=Sphingomonas sp. R-74633 TaxID=2751188 RepID=UPI0015D1862F|nr:Ig-like domain-containing protein [Sphingomonas sp. R-74633]NYT39178.1 tandem-95 repeat protein [Sphingomonas sp. R-74633]